VAVLGIFASPAGVSQFWHVSIIAGVLKAAHNLTKLWEKSIIVPVKFEAIGRLRKSFHV
jgi:hypothetical protein